MKRSYIIYACVAVLLIMGGFDVTWGYGPNTDIRSHFTYHFAHASVWHLAGNALCLFILINKYVAWRELLIAYTIATLCSFISSHRLPTVGLSGLIYALLGLRLGKCCNLSNDAIVRMAIVLLLPSLTGRVNVLLHILCVIVGYITTYAPQYLKRILSDAKRCHR